ncbi:hypothetical protein BH11VER1_BH11VER1_21990 [soil metagenome]
MCHFLTISIPGQAIPEVPDRFRDGIFFSEQNNSSINRFIPNEWSSFTVTTGGCSCDLYRDPKSPFEDSELLIKQYRKKGWSEAKIQRALESRKQTASHARGLRADVLELMEDLVKSHGEIRIALHWYAGDIGTEVFALHNGGIVSLNALKDEATLFLSETTVRIKRDGQLFPYPR